MIRTNRPLTRAQAIRRHKRGHWRKWSNQKIAVEQMNQMCLFVPFDVFCDAVADTLGREVWTHEFGDPEKLRDEMTNAGLKPSSGKWLPMTQ